MRTYSKLFLTAAIGALLSFSGTALAQPAKTNFQKTAAATDKKPAAKPAPAAAPTAAEIADAKAKGLVWVNTSTKVYHKEGQFYGTTKKGKFMTEADATKAGFHAAKEPAPKKTVAKTDPKKK
ncbi:MAG TPA: hypothetical protein VGP79_07175 [Bryobacteraceae bacterium]|jgi:hypothetical protein|nr:hypothetical protein [Bryobacteraceae bacterium]